MDIQMPNRRAAASDRLIVALDCDEREALALAESLEGTVRWLKVGMTLFYSAGPEIVRRMRDLGFDVFLDLKLHDIPHQVEGAAARVAGLGAGMLTVHAAGGRAMMEAAVRGVSAGASEAGMAPPAVLAVTVLTSMDDAGLAEIGVARRAAEQVALLGAVSCEASVNGLVCSPHEAASLSKIAGEERLIVTPGVRPTWATAGDQSRIATPATAFGAGATHLVVGRPITGAAVPVDAARRILDEMEESL